MRKFKLLFVAVLMAGMYACDTAATTEGGDTPTPADTTATESHEGHNH